MRWGLKPAATPQSAQYKLLCEVGAAIGRPYSLMHKHGGRPMAAPTTFPINFCVISQKNSPLLAGELSNEVRLRGNGKIAWQL